MYMVRKEMLLEEFQNGLLDNAMEPFLAILILHVAPMPHIKFQLNQT